MGIVPHFGLLTLVATFCLSSANAFVPPSLEKPTGASVTDGKSATWLVAADAAEGGDDTLGRARNFCEQEKNNDFCLKALYTFRCKQLAFPVPYVGSVCAAVGAAAVKQLDVFRFEVDLTDSSGNTSRYKLPVIFHGELESFIVEKAVQTYLDALVLELRRSIREESPFDLYAYTVNAAGSEETAIRWLALLLQDTTWVKNHVRWLARVFNDGTTTVDPEYYHAVMQLNEITTLLDPDSLRASNAMAYLRLYPEAIGARVLDLNPSFYHFYPMAYLAQTLKKGGVAPKLSAFIAYLFNAEYEFQFFAETGSRWPLQVPAPFKDDVNDAALTWKLQDIYEGYLGAQFGAGRMKSALTFPAYRAAFAKSPANHLRSEMMGR